MFRRKRNIQKDAAFVLTGAAIGGIVALLYAPKKGVELRGDIKNEVDNAVKQVRQKAVDMRVNARMTAGNLVNRAGEILNLSRQYVNDSYVSTADSIRSEIANLRRAMNAAVEAYRNDQKQPVRRQRRVPGVFTPSELDYSDETLPKVEGMGRRQE